MSRTPLQHRGFTLLELVTVVAVIAVLGAIAVKLYGQYTDRARAVEIIGKYDAIRSGSASALRAQGAMVEDCAELARALGSANLASPYATLSYGFEAATGGYRPVLNVCAQVGRHGAVGVHTARETHDTLLKNDVVEKGPLLTESIVSFSLRLGDSDRAQCKSYQAQAATACGAQQPPSGLGGPGLTQGPQPVSVSVPVPTASQPANQAQVPTASSPVGQTSAPLTNQPPAQTASQPAAQTPAKPPLAGNPQGTPQRPPTAVGQTLDANTLAASLMGHNELGFLNQRDQETVAATVAMMATNVAYALAVKDAIANVPDRRPAAVPTSQQNRNTIQFSGEMHRALVVLYPEALRRVCYSRNGPGANCG